MPRDSTARTALRLSTITLGDRLLHAGLLTGAETLVYSAQSPIPKSPTGVPPWI